MEILNASALEDWEISGKPEKWEKWTEKYQTEALQLVKNIFVEKVSENNIVCDISHFLHFADQAETDIPNQSRLYAGYWWEAGTVSESTFLNSAEKWLGENYKSYPNGRYVPQDEIRQVRYGHHETNSSTHHGHFESYDKPNGRVIENSVVTIIQD